MLAIVERWEAVPGSHINYTARFLLFIIIKAGMDTLGFFVFNKEKCRSFLGLCGLSITVMDWVMAFVMASVWFFGAERVSLSPCFLLAHSSATYGALPVPMICLGILDYCLDDTYVGRRRPKCKLLRNVVFILVVWVQAGIHSAGSANSEPIERQSPIRDKIILCIQENTQGIHYSQALLFIVVLLAIWPFHSNIFRWVKEAERLTKQREDEDNRMSDLFNLHSCTKGQICEKDYLHKTSQPRPPMWFSLTLAFGVTWMPYLTMTVVCLLSNMAIPTYIVINNLWLECTHSVLTGVVFWAKSTTTGPYGDLAENTCPWRVYWHLSRGTPAQSLPLGVFNPSKEKEKPFMCV